MQHKDKLSSWIPVALAIFAVLQTAACTSCSGDNGNGDSGKDTTSGDSDTDTDTDSDTDTDTDTDGDTDTDTDGDTDGDTDSDTDTWPDTDTAPELPSYCEIITPMNSIATGWAHKRALHNDYMVWRWIDVGSQSVLMARHLSTGTQMEVLRRDYPEVIDTPAIWADTIFFSRQIEPTDSYSNEIFRVDIASDTEVRITTNSSADGFQEGGANFVVYQHFVDVDGGGFLGGLTFADKVSGSETVIIETGSGVTDYAFDGTQWVVFVYDNRLYKYDITNPSAGYSLMYPDIIAIGKLSFNSDTGHLVTGTKITGETDDFDLEIWDMTTNARTTILGAAGSQRMPDAAGHLITFFDRELYSLDGGGDSEIRVIDQQTGAMRVVLPWNTWYSQGMWGQWVAANNYGTWGDSIILCDMFDGGLVDAEGHVIPEAETDGGVDGGK